MLEHDESDRVSLLAGPAACLGAAGLGGSLSPVLQYLIEGVPLREGSVPLIILIAILSGWSIVWALCQLYRAQ